MSSKKTALNNDIIKKNKTGIVKSLNIAGDPLNVSIIPVTVISFTSLVYMSNAPIDKPILCDPLYCFSFLR